MRIAFAFIALTASFVLWLLPITTATYDFRTDVREDAFTVATATGNTSACVILLQPIYGDDTNTIGYISSINETPTFSSYNSTTRELATSGLTENTTRTLTVSYDVNALTFSDAIDTFIDWVPFIWYMLIIAFPVAALVAIFTGR